MSGIGLPTHEGRGVAGVVWLADGTRLNVMAHCVDRFWERAATGSVDFDAARVRLLRLLRGAKIVDCPSWSIRLRGAERWIALTDEIGIVVCRRDAVTCLTRPPKRRQQRRNWGRATTKVESAAACAVENCDFVTEEGGSS